MESMRVHAESMNGLLAPEFLIKWYAHRIISGRDSVYNPSLLTLIA